MEEAVVTQLWMLGVVGVMVAYGVLTAIGAHRSANRSQKKR